MNKETFPSGEISQVRHNLMTHEGYNPYCGNPTPRRNVSVEIKRFGEVDYRVGCSNPRMEWDQEAGQFICPECGLSTSFPEDFIQRYLNKWK